jgi:hypothetical protein
MVPDVYYFWQNNGWATFSQTHQVTLQAIHKETEIRPIWSPCLTLPPDGSISLCLETDISKATSKSNP